MFSRGISPGQEGFALPSVLLMITLLSLVAISVLGLQLILRRVALMEIGKVKAEYAAESGIAKSLAEVGAANDILRVLSGLNLHFDSEDESRSDVELQPWGVYIRARSEGGFHQFRTSLTALTACNPSSEFDNALIFANATHQLVFTGSAGILGNVLTGQPGATVGNLSNYNTPIQIPIKGTLRRDQRPDLVPFDTLLLASQVRSYQDLLSGKIKMGGDAHILSLGSGIDFLVDHRIITDSLDYLFIRGNVTIDAKIARSERPLFVVVNGDILLKEPFTASGLVAILGSGALTIQEEVKIDEAILYSWKSVELKEGATVSAQLIAPSILLKSGSRAQYPSALISTIVGLPDSTRQSIFLSDGAQVEGFVGLYSTGLSAQTDRLITVRPGANVTGAIFSGGAVTLDGTVQGCVMTRDFYFYEPPTKYFGWLRSGTIDRTRLPSGYLVPYGFSTTKELDVLDWL